jgi:hypothetical protein
MEYTLWKIISFGGGATDFAETGSGIRKRKSVCTDTDIQTGAKQMKLG